MSIKNKIKETMSTVMKKTILFVLIFIPSIAFSDPSISSIDGTFVDGQQVQIAGADFGNDGPNIVLFDDFANGDDGEQASVDATVGQWTTAPSYIFSDSLLSKGQGARVVTTSGWVVNRFVFGGTYSEVFITSRAYVPAGYRFPRASALKTMPDISALKHHWIYYSGDGYKTDNQPDIFGINWTGKNFMNTTSNDSTISSFDNSGSPQWVWGEPVRLAHWLKGNGANATGSDGMFQAVSSSGQTLRSYKDYKAWFREDHVVYGWDRISVVGYLRSGCEYPTDNYVIDDVYVAVGANAAARVEIGDNSVYSSCTKMAISTPTQWTNTGITFTVREGTFKSGETAYLFVVDAENTPSAGKQITFGGQVDEIDDTTTDADTDTEELSAPTNLHIVTN